MINYANPIDNPTGNHVVSGIDPTTAVTSAHTEGSPQPGGVDGHLAIDQDARDDERDNDGGTVELEARQR